MFKNILICLLVLFSTVPAFAFDPNEEKVSKKWDVGAWELGEWKGKESGEFSHCTMSAAYSAPDKEYAKLMKTSELILMIKVNFDTSFNFIILGSGWNFTMGNKYKVRSRYSTGKVYSIMTTATGDKKAFGLDVNFGADGEWTQNFMKAEFVELFIEDEYVGKFYLKGSRDAMTALLNCYSSNTPAENEQPTFGEGQ
jgi:hypothetical protein